MSDENSYKVNNWAVNVDTGEFWHNCKWVPIWEVPRSRYRMWRGIPIEGNSCDNCDEIAPTDVFMKLYQAWRMFHIRDKKTYVNGIDFNGVSSFYLAPPTKTYFNRIITDQDFKNLLNAELARVAKS